MLFGALEPEVQQRLRDTSPQRQFYDGQFIQFHGETAHGFWLIEEGYVRVGQFLPEGGFRAVAVLGPGDSYGELALLAGTPRVVDALSRGTTLLRFIDGKTFLDLLADHPVSMRGMLGALSAQLQDLLTLLAGLRRGNNTARIAGVLANMARHTDQVNVTQQELAELLGVSRPTANTALRELEEAGLIERCYGGLKLLDREGLSMFTMSE